MGQARPGIDHLGTAFGETSPVYQRYHGLGYGTEAFDMTIIAGDERIPYRVIPLRPDRERRYDRAEPILRREDILRYYRVKGLKFSASPGGADYNETW